MGKKFFTFLLLTFMLIPFLLSQKHPITFNDFYSIARIKNFNLSPDGKLIVYTVKRPLIEENSYRYSIHLYNIAEKKDNILISNEDSNNFNPTFSPRGEKIAFLSDRSGKVQIYLMDLKSKNTTRITDFPMDVNSFIFSPDGKFIYFSSLVYKNCKTVEDIKNFIDEKKKIKSTAKIITSLMYRYWNMWINDKISHIFKVNLKSGKIDTVVGGNYWSPPIDLGSSHDFAISPDGRELAFTSSPIENKAISTNNDIYLLSLENGNIKNLTQKNKACDAAPLFSPDGKYLAFLSMNTPGFEADKRNIILYDRKKGSSINLTENFPNTITDFIWGNSNTIFFTCPEKGRRPIYKLDIVTKKIEYIYPSHFNRGLKYDGNNNFIYFMQESINHPIDIFRINLSNGKLSQLTDINKEILDNLNLTSLHEFYFEGANGDKVHALYIYPPNFKEGKKFPVVFLIHGGPQGDFSDEFHYRWNAQMFASPGFIVVMINFHGSVGYGQSFTNSVSKHWGGAPYEDIIKGVKFFLKHHPEANENKIGAAGASYGGFMINWIEGHTKIFKCLVSHDGPFDQRSMFGATEELWFPIWEFNGTPWNRGNFYEIYSPSLYVNNFKTPMLVIHSQKDYRVPVTQGFQLFTALQIKGVPSKLLYFSDEDHFVQKPQNAKIWWNEVLGWLKKYLSK